MHPNDLELADQNSELTNGVGMPSTPSCGEIRRRVIQIAFSGQTVHVPSAFSIVEIIKVLFESILTFPANDPKGSERDRFVLSKGHGVMALYPIFEARGWLDGSELENYFRDNSLLPGLCESSIPGCEVNSGSLGQGLGVAVGIAIGLKRRKSSARVFCLVGDGELNEGSTFEALSLAGQLALENLTIIVDLNGFQAMGKTKEIISQDRISDYFTSLGFHSMEIDGHSEHQLLRSLQPNPHLGELVPRAIIARTKKGKGISFMEDENSWHYTRLTEETFALALDELDEAS
jgi:transketolase